MKMDSRAPISLWWAFLRCFAACAAFRVDYGEHCGNKFSPGALSFVIWLVKVRE